MRKIIILFLALITIFLIVFEAVPDASTGTPLYNQQASGSGSIGSTSFGASGSVSESYPMGAVSLVYTGDSWQIAGNSVITRSSKEGLPTFDNSIDIFYFGSEELIRVDQTTSYYEYRTKRESHKLIRLYYPTSDSSSMWMICNPDGSYEYYQQRFKGRDDKTRAWGITEKKGIGGYDIVKYFYDTVSGREFLLKKIVSGKSDQTADQMTYIDYGVVPDDKYMRLNYRFGKEVKERYFPRIVYTFSGIGSTTYSWTLAEAYKYNDGVHGNNNYNLTGLFFMEWYPFDEWGFTGEWRLKQVTPCGSDATLSISRVSSGGDINMITNASITGGHKLNPTIYEYYPYFFRFSNFIDYPASNFGSVKPQSLSDLNTSIVDVDGDGLMDIVRKDAGSTTLHVWFNNYNRNTGNLSFVYQSKTLYDDRALNDQAGLYDWDNDGLADRVIITSVGTPSAKLHIHFGEPGGSFKPTAVTYTGWDYLSQSYLSTTRSGLQKSPLDMDGDGLPDKVRLDVGASKLYVNFKKSGVESEYANNSSMLIREYSKVDNQDNLYRAIISDLMDFNADGIPDRITKSGNGSKLKVRYGMGYRFTDTEYTINSDPDTEKLVKVQSDYINTCQDYIDINGDGLVDRVMKYSSMPNMVVWFNTGNGFASSGVSMFGPGASGDSYSLLYQVGPTSNKRTGATYIDMNADGLPDRVIKLDTNEPLKIAFNQLNRQEDDYFEQGGKLKSVIGPNGGKITYTYQPINKLQNINCKPNMYVIKEKKVWDGLQGSPELLTTYDFRLGKYVGIIKVDDVPENNLQIREFRGFGETDARIPTGDLIFSEYYTNDEYLAGNLKYSAFYNSFSTSPYNLVNETSYVYLTPISYGSTRVKLVLPWYTQSRFYDDNPGFTTKTTTYTYTIDSDLYITEATALETDSLSTMNTSQIYTIYENRKTFGLNYVIGLETITEVFGTSLASSTPITQMKTENMYYASGLLGMTRQWNGSSFVNPVMYNYDTYGNLTKVVDPKGNETTTTYDTTYYSYPKIATQTDDYTGSIIEFKTENFYDSRMRVTQVRTHDIRVGDSTDADVYTSYDEFGRVFKTWGPLPGATGTNDNYCDVIRYYGNAQIITGGTEIGKIQTPAYTKVMNIQKYGQYDRFWNITSVDGLGRTIQVRSNGPNSQFPSKFTRTIYKVEGYQTKVHTYGPFKEGGDHNDYQLEDYSSSPHISVTSYFSPSDGKATIIEDTDGKLTKTTEKRWVTVITDPLTNTTTSYKEGHGRVTSIIDASGTETKYFYLSGTGNLEKILAAYSKPEMNSTVFAYNMLGQKIVTIDPDLGYNEFTYDVNGNLATSKDAKKITTNYFYDKLNRLRQTTAIDGSTTKNYSTSYMYDDVSGWNEGYAKGKLVNTVTFIDGVITDQKWFKYDIAQRLITEAHDIDSKSAIMSYTYNEGGQITKLTYPDSEQVNYTYDTKNGMERMVVGETSTQNYLYVNNINYLPYGKILDMTYGNGVKTYYQYYDNGQDGYGDTTKNYQMKRVDFYKSGSGMIDHWQEYIYDEVGNIEHIKDKVPSYNQDFFYDELHRLERAIGIYSGSGFTYQYDSIGNMRQKEGVTLTYGDIYHIHAVTNDGIYTYAYDENGNMTSKTGASAATNRYYTYDPNSMLLQVTNGYIDDIFTAVYSGEERVKLVECTSPTTSITTYYFFPQYEEKWEGTTKTDTVKYYFSNGNRIAERRTTSGLKYYHKDHLGSTIRMSTTSGSSDKAIYYKPYGETALEGGTGGTDYKFNDKQKTDDLYYYGARYYDPKKHIIK